MPPRESGRAVAERPPAWYRRPRRVNLGRYRAPDDVPQATTEELVEEGVMIASAAVRMAVKNLVVLGSLRDHVDYDEEHYREAVRAELLDLATEKSADAERLSATITMAKAKDGRPTTQNDYRAVDAVGLSRRKAAADALSARLRELSDDVEFTEELARRAHGAAWAEVAEAVEERLTKSRIVEDAAYAKHKGERLLAVLGDLADLEAEQTQRRD